MPCLSKIHAVSPRCCRPLQIASLSDTTPYFLPGGQDLDSLPGGTGLPAPVLRLRYPGPVMMPWMPPMPPASAGPPTTTRAASRHSRTSTADRREPARRRPPPVRRSHPCMECRTERDAAHRCPAPRRSHLRLTALRSAGQTVASLRVLMPMPRPPQSNLLPVFRPSTAAGDNEAWRGTRTLKNILLRPLGGMKAATL